MDRNQQMWEGYAALGGAYTDKPQDASMAQYARKEQTVGNKRPELAEYMERMAVAISQTEELVAELEKRMAGVLCVQPTNPAGCGQDSPPTSTYYGGQVAAGVSRMQSVNRQLRDMMDRLGA